MIDEDGLKSGDKIPSERELSERLNVGRSSVREALRALELLGLIETRRGEGTFLRDARSNQLVQLLGTFILQDEKTRQDVRETKYLIEMDCLRLVIQRNNEEQLHYLRKWVEANEFSDDDFFLKMVEIANNHLLYRIWIILNDFDHSFPRQQDEIKKEPYLELIEASNTGIEAVVMKAYRKLRNLPGE